MHEDIAFKFNKPQQTELCDYQDKFEELRAVRLRSNMRLSEDYFISSFLSDFKEEIRNKVQFSSQEHYPKPSHRLKGKRLHLKQPKEARPNKTKD